MIKLFKKYREGFLYIIFGFLVTLINWTVYAVLVSSAGVGITVSNALAWLVAIIVAFFTNKFFVFQRKTNKLIDFIREFCAFLGSRVFTALLEIFLPTLLVFIGVNGSFLGIDGFWAKFIVNVIVILLNYILSKLLVFRKEKN